MSEATSIDDLTGPGARPPDIPDELLVLPLAGTVVYPLTVVPLGIAQEASVRLIDAALDEQGIIALTVRAEAALAPDLAGFGPVGTAALIHRLLRLPDGGLRIAAEGLEQIEIVALTAREPFLRARVRVAPDLSDGDVPPELSRLVAAYADELLGLIPGGAADLRGHIRAEDDPRRLSFLAAQAILFRRGVAERQVFLAQRAPRARLELLAEVAERELKLFRRTSPPVRPAAQPATRPVDTVDAHESEPRASEALAAPYGLGDEILDLELAERILAEEVVGLAGPRRMALEYLAARELRRRRGLSAAVSGARVLCFCGPSGCGKSALARALARAGGRQFLRMTLDTIENIADLPGLPPQPGVPAKPGAGSLVELDGIDRLPVALAPALARLLDRYASNQGDDQAIGDSGLLIAAARDEQAIPAVLRERLELVRIAPLTAAERVELLRRFLLPEQAALHGLRPGELALDDAAVQALVELTSADPNGVELERRVAALCRWAAARMLARLSGIDPGEGPITVDAGDLTIS